MSTLGKALLLGAIVVALGTTLLLTRTKLGGMTPIGQLPPNTSSSPEVTERRPEPVAGPAESRSLLPDPANQIDSKAELPKGAKKVDIDLVGLYERLGRFDSNRSWDTAFNLLQGVIQVEWDANGRFEDVTNKWDVIDPGNGHPLLKLPKYDPEMGFLDITDPRGTRWYRFTRDDFPEWWELRYPDGTTETGKQDGIAMPKKIAPELASSIRAHAAKLIEQYKDQ